MTNAHMRPSSQHIHGPLCVYNGERGTHQCCSGHVYVYWCVCSAVHTPFVHSQCACLRIYNGARAHICVWVYARKIVLQQTHKAWVELNQTNWCECMTLCRNPICRPLNFSVHDMRSTHNNELDFSSTVFTQSFFCDYHTIMGVCVVHSKNVCVCVCVCALCYIRFYYAAS